MKYLAFYFACLWVLTISLMWGYTNVLYSFIYGWISVFCACAFGYFQGHIKEVQK